MADEMRVPEPAAARAETRALLGEPYEYAGNFSAVDPAYSVGMSCHHCRVSWTGCWDNFQCPRCGVGELPSPEVPAGQVVTSDGTEGASTQSLSADGQKEGRE